MPELSRDFRVVILAPVASDARALAAMLRAGGIASIVAADAAQIGELVESGAGALVLTEEAFALPDAPQIMAALRRQAAWSELPAVILTSGGPARVDLLLELTAESAGSIILLERPTPAAVLLRAIRVALNQRRRQYEIRALLEEQQRRQAELEAARATVERELAERRRAESALDAASGGVSAPQHRPAWLVHTVAGASLAAAVGLRAAIDPLVGDTLPVSTLYAAIAVSVWFGGLLPALWVAVLGFFVCDWLFISPRHVLTFGIADIGNLILYGLGAGLMITVGVRMRWAERTARINADLALRRQQQAQAALADMQRAEETAREAEERLRVAVKDSRLMIAQTDRDLRYQWLYNPHSDLRPEQILGHRHDEWEPGDAAQRLVTVGRRVLESGVGATIDLSFQRSNGLRTYAYTLEPRRSIAGGIVGVTVAALDVTDRKQAEEELRGSRERVRQQLAELEAIYRAAPLGFAVFDRQLRYQRINERLAEINGSPPAAHLGRTVREVIPSLGDQAEQALRDVLETGRQLRFEFRGSTPSDPGTERVWDERWFPLRDGAGEIVAVGVVAEEITERLRQEKALREREELFRALAENVPQLAWMGDPDGSLFWYNRRWYDYTGSTLEEMRGWGWQKVHHPEHVTRVAECFRAALASGQPFEDTFPLRGRDGQFRWFLTRAFPIHDASGRITRWFGTNTDVTVLRDTQEALRDAQRRLREYAGELEKTVAVRTAKLMETVQELEAFSYSIAHDMRAPLRSMTGYARILTDEYAGALDQEAREYLRRIAASASRLDHLIQDILNYSRIVRGELRLEPIDPRALLLEVIDSYPQLSAARDRVTIASHLPTVVGNRAALSQVFSNLLENAVKFVPPGVAPVVRIWAEPVKAGAGPRSDVAWVRIVVEDNGIGIEAAARPRLFQMFQRFAPAAQYEGTGMGLAIARKAVERMGGTIGLDSEPGKGSRFWFLLERHVDGVPQ